MMRSLAAVARYLERPETVLIPWGHTGCEKLFPIDEDRAHPALVRARVGAALPASRLLKLCGRRRQLIADVVGELIAACLPPAYRGVYGGDDAELLEAREIAAALAS